MKILILKPSSLGDVVQALPVLRLLKRRFPQSQIYWWIEAGLAPLLEGDPDLAGVIPFDRRRWGQPANWLAIWRSILWMRAQDFDWVIDLQCLLRSGTVAWLAKGKLSIGLDEPREGARGFYDIIARRPPSSRHAVDWYQRVLPLLDVPVHRDFTWLPARPEIAAALRKKWSMDQTRWLALQPGARWLNKRWPAAFFAELIQRLAAGFPDYQFAILGGDEDKPLGRTVAGAGDRCLDLTGQLSLPEMVEWIRLCKLMVTNDTGPMHVAAALGTPVVGLFGPTEPCKTGPYGQLKHVLQLDLPCVPCLSDRCASPRPLECLRALSPAAVFQAIQRRLAEA